MARETPLGRRRPKRGYVCLDCDTACNKPMYLWTYDSLKPGNCQVCGEVTKWLWNAPKHRVQVIDYS